MECPDCGCKINSEDVNIHADIAKCGKCSGVFRPSLILGGSQSVNPVVDEPPVSENEPEGSKIVVEEFVGRMRLTFAPAGFNFGLIFMIGFATAWWSFLIFFCFGITGGFSSGEGKSKTYQSTSGDDNSVGNGSEQNRNAKSNVEDAGGAERSSGNASAGIFLALFMTPFFMAGLGMLFGILWPLFGRVTIIIASSECSHRAHIFGIGWTHRAPIDSTAIRWISDGRKIPEFARKMLSGHAPVPSCLLFSLGAWETHIGGTASTIEQEWVYHKIKDAIEKARQR